MATLKATLHFYPRWSAKSGNKVPVDAVLIYQRKSKRFVTDILIERWEWDAKSKTTSNVHASMRISDYENKIKHAVYQLTQERKDLSLNSIYNTAFGISEKQITKSQSCLKKHFDQFIEVIKGDKDLSQATKDKYENAYHKVFGFQKEDILLENINYQWIENFDIYLRDFPLARNTANKVHSLFKTALANAENKGLIRTNPYSTFRLKNKKVRRHFLHADELEQFRIADLKNNEALERTRDIYLFSVYTGLAFEDAQKLNMANIVKDNKGNSYFEVYRNKNGEPEFIPLTEDALNLISKYSFLHPDRLIPKITNQKFNAHLKVVALYAGITHKKLTHHTARHTFATTYTMAKGIDEAMVSKMLGHTNTKTTRIYTHITKELLGTQLTLMNKQL